MKKLKTLLLWPLAVALFIYRKSRERTYYIVGTGISKETGRRMWFKTVFITYGSILPLKSIAEGLSEKAGLKPSIITFFQRIPNSMRQYVDKEYDLEVIEIQKENEQ